MSPRGGKLCFLRCNQLSLQRLGWQSAREMPWSPAAALPVLRASCPPMDTKLSQLIDSPILKEKFLVLGPSFITQSRVVFLYLNIKTKKLWVCGYVFF